MKIPTGPEELTPEWLTWALRHRGTLTRAAVESFHAEIIGKGAGFISRVARVNLRYDKAEEGAPASLIAKFPSLDPEMRARAWSWGAYEKDVWFYQELAREISLRAPRHYFSDIDIEAQRFVLLIEDLAPARAGNQVAGCTGDEADLSIRHLAQFHADWWESPRLADVHRRLGILRTVEAADSSLHREGHKHRWGRFLEEVGDQLPASILEIGERIEKDRVNIPDQLAASPVTMLHGDYRLDHIFFPSPEGGASLAVVDWDSVRPGCGAWEVAYFLCGNMQPQERKAKEMELLSTYHTILMENGVGDYAFDWLLHDYRLSMLLCLAGMVSTVTMNEWTDERGLALRDVWLQRVCAGVLDLDVDELLAN